MTLKIIGAILIVLSCGGFGFLMVYNHRREVSALKQLISALNYIQAELQYNLTNLPELAKKMIGITKGVVRIIFENFGKELSMQTLPDAEICMLSALKKTKEIPPLTRSCFESLALTLGKFDLEGQENALGALQHNCNRILEDHTKNQDTRLRCYQTLWLCAGAALTILLI